MVFCGINYVVGFPITSEYIQSFIEDEDEAFEFAYNGNHENTPEWLSGILKDTEIGIFKVSHDLAEEETFVKKYSDVVCIVGITIGSYSMNGDSDFCIDAVRISDATKRIRDGSISAEYREKVGLFIVPADCLCCS